VDREEDNTLALAVETSGRYGSVAVGCGPRVLHAQVFSGVMRHSAELFETVTALLGQINKKAAHVEHVYLTIGPGSFTGLRIAATMAKMMALAAGTKIVTVGTLDALAANATDYAKTTHAPLGRVGTILDAKRGRFFAALFACGPEGWTRLTPDAVVQHDAFLQQALAGRDHLALLGEGLVYYRKRFEAAGVTILPESTWYPQASAVYHIARQYALEGRFADPVALVPAYIQGPDALELAQRRK